MISTSVRINLMGIVATCLRWPIWLAPPINLASAPLWFLKTSGNRPPISL